MLLRHSGYSTSSNILTILTFHLNVRKLIKKYCNCKIVKFWRQVYNQTRKKGES